MNKNINKKTRNNNNNKNNNNNNNLIKNIGPGCGFQNIGSTCFLNAVLQCILYIKPLKNYFKFSIHKEKCQINICYICEVIKLSNEVGNELFK
jgi:uncharacterized UBP type Zn finger protein